MLSLANWQMVTKRHHPWRLWRVVAIRPDRDDSLTFSPHTITPKTLANWQTVTNRHHPSRLQRVVTIHPDGDDPPTFSQHTITPPKIYSKSIANWQTVTKRHHHDDPSTCPKLTHRDEPSRSATDRHQFGDPLWIGCFGQPPNLSKIGGPSFPSLPRSLRQKLLRILT